MLFGSQGCLKGTKMKLWQWLLGLCWLMAGLSAHAFGLADLSQRLQQPQAVAGDFTQERYMASLGKPLRTEGEFVLQPKRALLWQMQKPFAQQLRVRADGVWQWTGKAWQRQSGGGGQQRQMQLFLDLLGGNAQGLQQHFEVRLTGTEQAWQLALTPKTALMQQIFTRIDIAGDNVVRQITLQEKQGDKTVMRFSRIRINPALAADTRRALAD